MCTRAGGILRNGKEISAGLRKSLEGGGWKKELDVFLEKSSPWSSKVGDDKPILTFYAT